MSGYRWVRCLGHGGSGVVYEATAPGGFAKAIKIVPLDPNNPLSEREYQGLMLVRSIRHPFLLSIDRVDVDSDHMTIVMELVDHNLRNEFYRRTLQGAAGLPRDHLLRLLEESAEVLDLLNNTYKVQHLDVKPENLFIVAGHIKLGDFGLLRNVESDTLEQRLNAISPAYASPELFDGRISRASDQYSLAVVYMEMLTGRQPFTAIELRQAAMQRLIRPPDLMPLPECDRPVIGRALERDPAARFDSCRSLVDALRASSKVDAVPVRLADGHRPGGEGALPGFVDLAARFVLPDDATVGRITQRELGKRSATTTVTCLAQATPASLLAQIPPFAQQWGAEILDYGMQTATLRFAARANWWRRLFRKEDSITVRFRLFQREGKTTTTLVQMTVSYHGGKVSKESFDQYCRSIVQLIKSFLIPHEGSPTHVRQHPRIPISCPVSLLRSGPAGITKEIPCTAIDYSARGLGLISQTAVNQGTVQIRLPGAESPLEAQLVSCHRQNDGNYRLGLFFAFEPEYPKEFILSGLQPA
jgi:hypothetical protein